MTQLYKECSICKEEKSVDDFFKRKLKSGKISRVYACKPCYKIINKNNKKKDKELIKKNKKYILKSRNKKLIKKNKKEYYLKNKERILKSRKEYYLKNKDDILKKKKEKRGTPAYKAWKLKNKDRHREQRKLHDQKRRLNDKSYKLRKNVSKSINDALKAQGSSKAGQSIINYLPYSVIELKTHLESLFENWMYWDNWGVYNPYTWDDNDSSTWIWHIDHIIPQSKLLYDSMNNSNFQKCWSLDNLRPLSAKENILKGDS